MSAPSLAAKLVCLLVRGYQLVLSPLFRGCCRFTPSCSAYMIEAVTRFGALRGGWMGLKRLGRCNPWHAGGFDPVPEKEEERAGRGK